MNPYYKENFDFINSFYPLNEEVYGVLYSLGELRRLRPKTKLLDLGEIPQKIYLINKGVIRSYVITDNGKELTKSLFTPIVFFASFNALLNNKPTETIYETLTDCDVFEIDYPGFAHLCSVNFDVMKFYSKFLEYLIIQNDDKHIEIISLGAKERYLKLRERIPDIDNLIPQYQIASSLGVTPVQLSRIRSKL